MNWWGSGFIQIINYSSIAKSVNPSPPGTDFMITEIDEDNMVTEDGYLMITE